jgi:hypothetical protein
MEGELMPLEEIDPAIGQMQGLERLIVLSKFYEVTEILSAARQAVIANRSLETFQAYLECERERLREQLSEL